mgnify:CR=1 FL=1
MEENSTQHAEACEEFFLGVARQASASETIKQSVVLFKPSRKDREGTEKRKVLRDMILNEGKDCKNAIIFCNRKSDVDICAKSLKKYETHFNINKAPTYMHYVKRQKIPGYR